MRHTICRPARGSVGGKSTTEALEHLGARSDRYDPVVLDALEAAPGTAAERVATEIDVNKLLNNMVLAADVNSHKGALVVCKGQKATDSVRAHLANFHRNGLINETVMAWMAGDG